MTLALAVGLLAMLCLTTFFSESGGQENLISRSSIVIGLVCTVCACTEILHIHVLVIIVLESTNCSHNFI